MLKYKVGDKVRVRKDLEAWEDYGVNVFNPLMALYRGKITTIKRVRLSRPVYDLDIDDGLWNWTDEMLEPASPNQKIVITTDGNTTLARFYEDGKVVKTAEARRKPNEAHNFKIGARYAFDRLIEDKADEPEAPERWNAKVICTKSGAPWWTVGKVYEIVNGVIHDDDGDTRGDIKPLGNIIVLEITTLATFQKVTAEQPPRTPQYYTGKVFCVDEGETENSFFTTGKIYQVTNGRICSDQGKEWFSCVPNIRYLNAQRTQAKFIEVKE